MRVVFFVWLSETNWFSVNLPQMSIVTFLHDLLTMIVEPQVLDYSNYSFSC